VSLDRRKRNILIISFAVFIVIVWLVFSGWLGKKCVLVESTSFLMNTSVTVKIFAPDEDEGRNIIQEAFVRARALEHIMEPLKGDGELKRINSGPPGVWWGIGSELRTVLERSIFFHKKSGGAFDPTIGAVKWLWDFENGGRLPSEEEIRTALKTVGLSYIELRGDSLNLGTLGSKLDLGGVAKGYVVDRMVDVLRDRGIEAGLVNAGGNIFSFGKKPGGKDWVIGLRHPRTNQTIVMEHVLLPAVATSGDYERYFIKDGIRYHHILDPVTGYPARGCMSVTVWAETAIDADILSTTIFVLGPEKGLVFAESQENVETLIIYETPDGGVGHVFTTGVKDKITF